MVDAYSAAGRFWILLDKKEVLECFYRRIIIQRLVTRNIILALPSSNYQIVSYEIAIFLLLERKKRYIFETIIFIRSKYEPLALMTFSNEILNRYIPFL